MLGFEWRYSNVEDGDSRSSGDILDAVQSFLIDSTPAGTAVGSPHTAPCLRSGPEKASQGLEGTQGTK
jgi:hypothetical protein